MRLSFFSNMGRWSAVAWLLFIGPVALLAQTSGEIRNPWGVAALTNGDLVVMETQGRMLRVAADHDGIEVMEHQFGPLAVDLTVSAQETGEDTIFVSLRLRRAGGAQFNWVRQYTADGEEVLEGAVSPSDSFAGIAADAGRESVWLVNAAAAEIHVVSFDELRADSGTSKRLVRIGDVGILGPLAHDVESNRLFVADSLKGTLYSIPLESLVPEQIAEGLGEPQALAVDRENGWLFAADPAGRRVWRLDLANPGAAPKLFSKAPELRSPVGLTVAPDGTVWVADPEANKLLSLGPEGEVTETIP